MEEGKPIVSICCITYNHELYIRDCLDGFVMQKTDFSFEIIINDDASTDKTQDIIREYEAKYPSIIKPIYQKVNQYSQGINPFGKLIFPKTRGKYIAICEGDDYWIDPLKLQKQVDFLEANPEYSMCFHKAHEIREGQENFSPIFKHLKEGDYTGDEIIKKWIVPTASVVLRSGIIHHVPVNPKFTVGDNVLWLTCARYGKIRCLNGEGAVYRMLLTGWVSSHQGLAWVDQLESHLEALKECFPEVSKTITDCQVQLQVTRFYYMVNPVVKVIYKNLKINPFKFHFRMLTTGVSLLTKIIFKRCIYPVFNKKDRLHYWTRR